MTALIALGIAFVLLASFVGLLRFEQFRGARFFEKERSRFDVFIRQAAFVIKHVDFSSFTWTLVKESLLHVAHLLLQSLLLGIRSIERVLTRTVRGIRVSKAEAPNENSLKTTSEFLKKVATRSRELLPRNKKPMSVPGEESSAPREE